MAQKLLVSIVFALIVCFSSSGVSAQDDPNTFKNFQFSSDRVTNAWNKYNDSLRSLFKSKGVAYPPKDIYIRSFKSMNEMEVWARNEPDQEYKLIKLYRICALSGILGPKRYEGDRQVPEGFYFIEDFNPRSDYHLSMLINYPNYSDLMLSNKTRPGGDIYIHGGCVTVGCMPMTDDVIQEIYTLCLNAKINGQIHIPVHIFPTRFNDAGLNFLGREYGKEQDKQQFWVNLKAGYDYFEKHHKIFPVVYTPEGKYAISNN
ncbi:MAG: L,D-transpeptidase family protein [Flavipsychrobacter sp.]|nr:L,D-transpeptidase family protein [Flavipsychrobacter sp.]